MGVYFPEKTIDKMKRIGLSEAKVSEVLHSGKVVILPSGAEVLVKRYTSYEVGLFYKVNTRSGDYIITHVWKRDRR